MYDFAHIGNFRTFVFADLVRRYLEFKGFAVRHVMNITDVEDKIIQRVRETKTTLREYTAKYEAAFFEDFQALSCLRPHETPHATDHIAEIIALIEKLVARGLAYRAAGRLGLFQHREIPGRRLPLRPVAQIEFRGDAPRPARRQRRIRQGSRGRFRALEGPRRRKTARSSGPAPGARAGPAGTSNAAP